jgi:hypothetical protein
MIRTLLVAGLAALSLSVPAGAATRHQKHMMNVHRGHMKNVREHVHHQRMHMMNVHRGHMHNIQEHMARNRMHMMNVHRGHMHNIREHEAVTKHRNV